MDRILKPFGGKKKLAAEQEEQQHLREQNLRLQAELRQQEWQREREKVEEVRKLQAQLARAEIQRKEDEAHRREQDARRQREEENRRMEEARRRDEDARRLEQARLEEVRRRDEEARRREQEAYAKLQQIELARQEALRLDRQAREEAFLAEQKAMDEAQRKREERLKKFKDVTPDSLYKLRKLIRQRYALDVEIWALRGVKKADRGIVEDKMRKADALMAEITTMVHAWEGTWEGTDKLWTRREWDKAQDVRERILMDNKRLWEDSPPWDEEEEGDLWD
jgi:hypothetical protein